MVAVISKTFGLQHIELAEDIVSETFLIATDKWNKSDLPENPTAWLYATAKNKTVDYLRRNKLFNEKISPDLKRNQASYSEMVDDIDFTEKNISDSQLKMIFAICDPLIANEAQISLALRILCGFGIDEIAEAFLSTKSTVNKRLFRAKEKLRNTFESLEFPPDDEIHDRLDNVLSTLYLLFNEGYYSSTQNETLQKDLCLEATRLCFLLTEYPPTNTPQTNALLSLMCFNASRLNARINQEGNHLLYDEQNKDLWDDDLIEKGQYFLQKSANGNEISSYHLEAAIAHYHANKNTDESKWENVLQLYNKLLQINYSPIVALNRTYAFYKARGTKLAIPEAKKLKLEKNHFYFILLAELYLEQDANQSINYLEKALKVAKNKNDKNFIQEKINKIRITNA